MKKACVVGNPIEHSLSPTIFRYLSKKLDVPIQYEKKCVQDVRAFKKDYFKSDVIGCNVTYPFKEEILLGEELLSRDVRFLQASNMIFHKEGKLHFYNTDWMGFKESLGEAPEKALIIGFGSTARSVLYALCQMGTPQVDIAMRTPKFLELAKSFQRDFPRTQIMIRAMPQGILSEDIIINTAPLNARIDLRGVSKDSLVYDVNYAGDGFLKDHPKRRDGLSMLIYQALITWEIWFHTVLDKKDLHKELRENIL